MKLRFTKMTLSLASLLPIMAAQASGFEKVILWSGKQSGHAGAAASNVEGSESLMFNPAGLAAGERTQKFDVSLNVSPTWPRFEGPLAQDNKNKKSSRPLLPIAGMTAGYKQDRLGLGIGLYTVGGAQAKYTIDPQEIFPAQASTSLDVKTNLRILETSLGAAYKVLPGWTLGASWRVTRVDADFSTLSPYPVSGTSFTYLNLHGLKQTKYDGFRLGTQYRSSDNSWGVGAHFRSRVNFNAKGKAEGKIFAVTGATPSELKEGDASAKSSFPWALDVGGDFLVVENLRLFTEYSLARYSNNRYIELGGNVMLGTTPVSIAKNLELGWNDLHVLRLAGEYTGFSLPIRAGYAFSSPVSSISYARATFVAPGAGHTFALGSGMTLLNDSLDLDAAANYSFASKKVSANEGVAGTYKTNAYALHMGATYRF